MKVPIRLIEIWLTLCHGALCRQVAGGLIAQLPADVELLVAKGEEQARKLVVLFEGSNHEQLEAQAKSLFNDDDWLFAIVADDIKAPGPSATPHLSLRRALSELQTYLLDSTQQNASKEMELLSFFLKHGEYRSRHISIRRTVYHVVPYDGGWKVKRQGQDEGETYSNKEEAIRAGADRARAHAAGQLIIHAADGTFQEERTYGSDPTKSQG